eukprot:scaffold4184_cov120-Isochrysis_galbana.AAC.6
MDRSCAFLCATYAHDKRKPWRGKCAVGPTPSYARALTPDHPMKIQTRDTDTCGWIVAAGQDNARRRNVGCQADESHGAPALALPLTP